MKKIIAFKFTVLISFGILYGLLMPGDSVPDISISIPHLDKVIHFGIFLCLTSVFYLEYFHLHKKLPFYLYSILGLFIFGVITEILQGMLTSSRMADPIDLVADMFGVIVSIFIFPLTHKVFQYFVARIKRY